MVMVDTGLIIEGIHISIDIYKRIKKVGKLPKKLEGLESHISYIEGILADKRFEEKLKSGNYPRLTGILEELRAIVLHAFPELAQKVKPEHKDLLWYVNAFVDVNSDGKKCEKLLTDMDSVILKFSHALLMENFNDLKDIKDAIDELKKLAVTHPSPSKDINIPDRFDAGGADASQYGIAVAVGRKKDMEKELDRFQQIHDPNRPLAMAIDGAKANDHAIAIAAGDFLPNDAKLIIDAAAGLAAANAGNQVKKKKKEKKKEKVENPSSSSSSSSSIAQAPQAPSSIAPHSAFLSSSMQKIEDIPGLYLISGKGFTVSLDYVELRLNLQQRKDLQGLLEGDDGLGAFGYIEESLERQGTFITQLSFRDKRSADILFEILKQSIMAWKNPQSALSIEKGETLIPKQF